MKLRSPFWKPNGWEGLAFVETHRNDKELFKPLLRVGGPIPGPVSTFLAKLADYEILEATDEEIVGLRAAGYELRGCDRSPVAVVERVSAVDRTPAAERPVFRKADLSTATHALRRRSCRLKCA